MRQQYSQFFESPTDEIMKLVCHCAAVQRFSTIVIPSKGKNILWTMTEESAAINHSDREREWRGSEIHNEGTHCLLFCIFKSQ